MNTDNITQAVVSIVQGDLKHLEVADLDRHLQAASTRETIRMAFQDMGVEIEFSGKDAYEKGVVIDIDTDKMQQLGLDPDTLKFGQTVVRAKPPVIL